MSARAATSTPQIDWALHYAGLGWSVVPAHRIVRTADGQMACTCAAGLSCVSKGKHPAVPWTKYQTDPASTDQLVAWFEGAFADYNVGIITGAAGKIIVIDVDTGPGKEGAETLQRLQLMHGDLPHTPTATTGGGGLHIVLRHPGHGIHITTARNVLGPGVDVRGDGGFIVASPSAHLSGRYYFWSETAHPANTEVAEAPGWLVAMASGPGGGGGGQPTGRAAAGEVVRDGWGQVTDGRERHMVGIVCGVITTVMRDTGLLPTAADVFAEAWPTYEGSTRARGTSLEDDGRGPTLMRQRITHFLARAETGKWRLQMQDGRTAGEQPGGPGAAAREAGTDAPKSRLRMLTLAQLEALPAPAWVVDRLVQENSLVVPYGAPKSGKSYLILSMCLHVAAGMPWAGHDVRQGAVVYIAMEGTGFLGQRTRTMRRHYGIADTVPLWVVPHRLNFMDPKTPAELLGLIRGTAGDTPIGMVVVDTLARAMSGGDENSAQDVGVAVAGCDTVREQLGCVLVVVAHQGKDVERGLRGSSALHGALDTSLHVEATDGGATTMRVADQKDAEAGEVLSFDMPAHPVPGVTGRTSLVPLHRAATTPAVDQGHTSRPYDSTSRTAWRTSYAARMLERALSKHGRPAPDRDGFPPHVPCVTEQQFRMEFYEGTPGQTQEAKKKAFQRAVASLLASNTIASFCDLVWFVRDRAP